MATTTHPLTGVKLNRIYIKRKALSERDAVTAIILRHKGTHYQDIAQMLGTNTHRLGEVFRGEIYPNAHKKALKLLN
ncbi:hypothetical protein [Yoonia sp. 208BN28-4]|uniref:hypothetical protein n=1 Tax=Yoonia sp. 208BN28-4 TaxID=3126505 RepID=UPI0030A504E6